MARGGEGMVAGLAQLLGDGQQYFLFDSFEGLPPAKDVDGDSARAWQADTKGEFYFDNCTAEMSFAREAMRLSGARDVTIVKGWFKDTLPKFTPPSKIALLRLDGDWFESTLTCLECLYSHLSPDGLVILDDYYYWDGCSERSISFWPGTGMQRESCSSMGSCVHSAQIFYARVRSRRRTSVNVGQTKSHSLSTYRSTSFAIRRLRGVHYLLCAPWDARRGRRETLRLPEFVPNRDVRRGEDSTCERIGVRVLRFRHSLG